MLTIKHIEKDGHEGVIQAIQITYAPQDDTNNGAPGLTAYGSPGPDEGARKDGVISFGDGRVYVMNDNGKTVATYNLD